MSGYFVMPKPRTDYAILQTWYNLAKYLAYTPINPDKRLPYLTKTYPFFLMAVYLGATMFSFYERFYFYDQFNISQEVLDFIQGLAEFLFVEHVVLWSILKRNRWRKMIKSMAELEQKLIWPYDEPVRDTRVLGIRIRIFLYHIVYLAVHIYDSITNWIFLSYSLAFVIFRITTYYIMFTTLFLTFICTWTKNRYLYLDHFLKVSASAKNLKLAVLQKEAVYERLAEFSQHYKDVYLIVKEINAAFGIHFFLVAICTVLEILNAINYGMPTQKHEVNHNVIGVNVLFLTVYVICNVQIVMSCDSVGESAKRVWKTSLILHERAENRELRKEFLRLAHYIQGLRPEFSAAGFWTVNQSVLSTLFSSVMTYVIIIIQFNMTLK